MYDLKGILDNMNVTFYEFQSRCIVSGTDYNLDMENNTSLTHTLKFFKKYKQITSHSTDTSNNNITKKNNTYNSIIESGPISFYEWLEQNTKYIKNSRELYNIQDMFNLKTMPEYKQYEKISIVNGPIHKRNLMNVLDKEHFLFVE